MLAMERERKRGGKREGERVRERGRERERWSSRMTVPFPQDPSLLSSFHLPHEDLGSVCLGRESSL